ncbi:hypothetical protein ACQ9AQ_19260 [Escherichia coli]|uniref:glycine-rich domain-containing protein n=1 Tax=Escherichia coli TaxID=562 RepID=UPI001BEBE00C|nr:hypothetical protein [Escherichia coli]ELH3081521.1 hypothetical protein [Escherichia coli]DAV19550.1 MAG TPA: hypothetical protein [Caudoviricetes sp.]HCO3785657.1 hypothetical protein [Escherichia coli]HCO5444562.1 hypothetical protein [Escherichia coli]
MAKNDFKPFATGSGANVMSQTDWEALPALLAGFQSGKASSAQINKAFRQSSFIAAALAQFIADTNGTDVLDNGNFSDIVLKLKSAISTASTGRLLNVRTFTSSGTYTPTAGTKFVVVEVQGGGGGSGGVPATGSSSVAASGAGGAGAYAKAYITSGFSGVSVTVGAGGAAGSSGGGDGGAGGTSSFGSLVSCPGGTGGGSTGSVAVSFPTSRGGSTETAAPTGGNIISSKGKAGAGSTVVNGTVGNFGTGAASPFSAGGTGGDGENGSGGGGWINFVSQSARAGYAGGKGLVVVWEYA